MASCFAVCCFLVACACLVNAKSPRKMSSFEEPPQSSARRNYVAALLSPQVTYWGDWSAPAFCADGHFVYGMRLRVEESLGSKRDDTSLNAIEFLCAPIGTPHTVPSSTLKPHNGYWGNWRAEARCQQGKYAVGYRLRAEGQQSAHGDNVAATNLRLLCTDSSTSWGSVTPVQTNGSGMDWGNWSGEQRCPLGSALCGLRVQVEAPVGGEDDTALNNVVAYCCRI
ncbi:putative Vitelline membrane outer layer protein 1-like protein [Hypsibius exemplaris]|uniref:Vitelline membrane outer layer protein 1-like protein n=1 Tax=Hypsibius exemplaris TaxID=2072580 RepID=A0A1W0WSS1_HYPEX|nr:putative Vitelline membrane outer layer protein 1-like protein [Hypsibius exemplaris]